jgi:type II secretory pathway component PulF
MPQFSYKARKRSGEVVTGVLDVADRGAALAQIERLGFFPLAIEAPKGNAPVAENRPGARSATDFLPPALRQFFNRQRKPKLQELATYTRQLSNLIKSGMPLTVALGSMAHLQTKGIPAEVSRELRQNVMEGKGLSEAMARQPVIFSNLYVNMVRAGEQSGSLVEVLNRMAMHFERFAEVQGKFKSALIYPAFVCAIGSVIVVFFMTFMLPKFLQIFEGFKVPLPLATRILIGGSHFVTAWWWAILAVIFTVVMVVNRYAASEQGKVNIDRWKMKFPILGKVVQLNLFGQFARTLSTLLQNGVPVLTALEITESIIPNLILKEAIHKTREQVTDGKTIAEPLARSKLFPQLMVDLIKIGEETGDVPGALSSLADTYENELRTALQVVTNMIEPLIICCLALGVGFLLLSVLSAMFAMTSSISSR